MMSGSARLLVLGVVLAGAGAARAQDETSYSVEGKVRVEVEISAVPPLAQPTPPAPIAVVTGGQIRTLERVYFESRGECVREASRPVLDAVASLIVKSPGLRQVRVEAHTDNVIANNDKLSQRRAEWVRAYLVKKGVPPERVVAKGYGSARPIATNETPEGRALNRRVEFVIGE